MGDNRVKCNKSTPLAIRFTLFQPSFLYALSMVLKETKEFPSFEFWLLKVPKCTKHSYQINVTAYNSSLEFDTGFQVCVISFSVMSLLEPDRLEEW